MAVTETESALEASRRLDPAGWRLRLTSLLRSENSLVHRLVGTIFIIRVAAAALAFVSQIFIARWMGTFEFGIYVYVWTWVLLIGQSLDLGLATASQRFVPEYRDRGLPALLRGYIFGTSWLSVGIAIGCAGLFAAGVWLLRDWVNDYTLVPLYLACLIFPAYALANVQDGISRSYDWMGLGIVPTYIVRQVLLTVLLAAAYYGGLPVDATTGIVIAGVSIWIAVLGQTLVLHRRLRRRIEPGPREYRVKTWFAAALPILLVEGFYVLLAHTDVLVLQMFRTPEEVAVYYAAAKTIALLSFVFFAVSATATHRFSSFHVAGDHEGLATFLAQTVRWTFWPSLAVGIALLALGKPILNLFGPDFDQGYPLMFVLVIGLLARASIGPVEKLLNMLGEQRICAVIYLGAFLLNLALCFVMIPALGAMGAAIATATALSAETVVLFIVTRRRLGFHVFIFGRPDFKPRTATPAD